MVTVPYLLVASPTMLDENFARTVVLMLSHDKSGAHGLVINRSLDITVREVAENLELDEIEGDDLTVLWGGPVDASTGFVVVENPWDQDEEEEETLQEVLPNIGIGVSRVSLERAMRRAEDRYLLCLGYAGWAPRQLEAEIAQGAWIEADLDPDLVFQIPLDDRWDLAIRSLGIDNPAYLSTRPVDE